MHQLIALLATLFAFALAPEAGADEIPSDLKRRMESLSASLTADGAGPAAYEALLHPDYSRWSIGEACAAREPFLKALAEWWNNGMRVSERNTDIVGADISGDIAIIRMKADERFAGPEGDAGGFTGDVVNVWLREDNEWRLLSADVAAAGDE